MRRIKHGTPVFTGVVLANGTTPAPRNRRRLLFGRRLCGARVFGAVSRDAAERSRDTHGDAGVRHLPCLAVVGLRRTEADAALAVVGCLRTACFLGHGDVTGADRGTSWVRPFEHPWAGCTPGQASCSERSSLRCPPLGDRDQHCRRGGRLYADLASVPAAPAGQDGGCERRRVLRAPTT